MNRIKKSIAKRFSSQKEEKKTEKRTEKAKSRNFENPHRFASPEAIQVYSEFTPGLGRRIPELSQEGVLFEVKYANNAERRVEWLYSPVVVPFYRSSRKQSDLDSGFYTGSAGRTDSIRRSTKPEIFTFDEKDIHAISSSGKCPLNTVKELESPLYQSNECKTPTKIRTGSSKLRRKSQYSLWKAKKTQSTQSNDLAHDEKQAEEDQKDHEELKESRSDLD